MTQPSPTEAVTIRPARPDEADAIAALRLRSWLVAYRGVVPDGFLDYLASMFDEHVLLLRARLLDPKPEERWWVAERAGALVGFSITGPTRDNDPTHEVGEVQSIYLDPQFIGTGAGRPLFTHSVDELLQRGYRPLTLWVMERNTRARAFYEAAGWRPDGAIKEEERPGGITCAVRYRLASHPAVDQR